MEIKFETFDIPDSICKQEISAGQKEKVVKQVAKADANLRKKMKRIDRVQAEAWKKSRHRGRIE